jgi:peptidoglycan/LPS O-acetylase OafA/YrhL
MKIQRLVVLDLIRIFAALAVAMYHAAYLSWSSPASTPGSVLKGAASYPETNFALALGMGGR